MKYVNNPLNIRNNPLNKWIGQTKTQKGFCTFDTLEHGLRAAAYILIRSYRKKGVKTVYDIIYRWAPPEDKNPTSAYARFVARSMGVDVDYVLETPSDYGKLIKAMSRFEQGYAVDFTPDDVVYIIGKYKLKIS